MTRLEAERVANKIADAILRFCHLSVDLGNPVFHMDELRKAIEGTCGAVAPDSPGRVLRSLRQRGLVDYYVSNRAKSEYTIRAVGAERKHA